MLDLLIEKAAGKQLNSYLKINQLIIKSQHRPLNSAVKHREDPQIVLRQRRSLNSKKLNQSVFVVEQ